MKRRAAAAISEERTKRELDTGLVVDSGYDSDADASYTVSGKAVRRAVGPSRRNTRSGICLSDGDSDDDDAPRPSQAPAASHCTAATKGTSGHMPNTRVDALWEDLQKETAGKRNVSSVLTALRKSKKKRRKKKGGMIDKVN